MRWAEKMFVSVFQIDYRSTLIFGTARVECIAYPAN